jgi:arylsulfatase
VRVDNWKLVSLENSPWELYDIDQDRGEMHNVAKQHPEKVKRLAEYWDKYVQQFRVEPYGAHSLRERAADPPHAPQRLELKSGDIVERPDGLALSEAGLKIEARVSGDKPRGVIVAQGAGQHGFSLYMWKGRVRFAVRRAGALQTLSAAAPITASPVTVIAELTRHGQASLRVGDQPATTADFYGPLLATPESPLSVGRGAGGQVGEYPKDFPFEGTIESVTVETIRP